MRKLIFLVAPVIVMLAGEAPAAPAVDDVVALAQKGIGEEVLIAFVQASDSAFKISTAEILRLKDAKVPEKVIVAMLRHRPAREEAARQELGIGRADEAAPGAREATKLFQLRDGRTLFVVGFFAAADEYVVKTDQGRLVTLKKGEVAAILDLDRKAGERQAAVERRESPERIVERERIVEVPRTTYVYSDSGSALYRGCLDTPYGYRPSYSYGAYLDVAYPAISYHPVYAYPRSCYTSSYSYPSRYWRGSYSSYPSAGYSGHRGYHSSSPSYRTWSAPRYYSAHQQSPSYARLGYSSAPQRHSSAVRPGGVWRR